MIIPGEADSSGNSFCEQSIYMGDSTIKRLLDLHELLRAEKKFCNSLIRNNQSQEVINLSGKRIEKITDEINALSSGKLSLQGK
ncbi:MAG: hypothetical protein ABUT20_26120 [Bacteroidota bacterium]